MALVGDDGFAEAVLLDARLGNAFVEADAGGIDAVRDWGSERRWLSGA